MAHNQIPDIDAIPLDEQEPQLQVVVHAGPLAGKGYLIQGDTITFGRDTDNDIIWEDGQVSRHHARITRRAGKLILEDLGSTNGTLVNGRPISGAHILQPADIISIGTSIFGVKGFAAPPTVSVTQLSAKKPDVPSAAPPSPRPLPSPARPAAAPPSTPLAKSGQGLSLLTIAGVVLVIAFILVLAGATAFLVLQMQQSATAQGPTVVITAPADRSRVPVGQPTTVQATAQDPSGVVRLELWISGQKVAETLSPVSQGQPTLTASMEWIPAAPGNHTLEVKAFNVRNVVGQASAITIRADTGEVTPSATFTPAKPTDTPAPTEPLLTARTDLNVRTGPGMEYDLLGLLPASAQSNILGKSADQQWWQIKFQPGPGQVGWVAADAAFSQVENVTNVPVVIAPPTPTGTPSPTPTNTSLPTFTPIPATATPTATPSPSATPATQFEFKITPTEIQFGQCVEVIWNVSGVKEVYYQGNGVAGNGKTPECPPQTTTYRLRVVKQDNTEQVQDITVTVSNPNVSSGSRTLRPGDTIDFDTGQSSGDDFMWLVDNDRRAFTALEGVRLAPMSLNNSLDGLTLAACLGANYDEFTYLDGSDVILNPNNELTDGRTACYVTNQGRVGKMRFPKYSTGDIAVEWLTWDKRR